MNKDIIYVAEEDDITTIIADLKSTKQKIVAIVPPKENIRVFCSSINIKLIAKTAREFEKVVVFVTEEPTIMRLAMNSHIPIAPNLKSRPVIPSETDITSTKLAKTSNEKSSKKDILEDFVKEPESASKVFDTRKTDDDDNDSKKDENLEKKPKKHSSDFLDEDEETEDELEKSENKETSDKNPKKKKRHFIDLSTTKNKIIFFSILGVVVIGFLVWAIFFSASATVNLTVKTTSNSFSESVTFSTKLADEDPESGKFALNEEKYVIEGEKVAFTATGKKDVGEKATGEITVYTFFKTAGEISVPAGTSFAINDLAYTTNSAVKLEWLDEDDDTDCEDGSSISKGCLKSTKVTVTAVAAGEKYNISAHSDSEWSKGNYGSVSVYNVSAFTGGTSKIVTYVQASDVEAAKEKLETANDTEGKEALKNQVSDSTILIDSTFKRTVSDPVVSPAIGEEVPNGTTPTIQVSTTFTEYSVDLIALEKFINAKSNLGEDQKIYDFGSPFLERFLETSDGYSAKLKTTYKVGPNVNESEILEKIQGKKVGEARTYLKSINGISATIETSFPWVFSIPNDSEKITININNEE